MRSNRLRLSLGLSAAFHIALFLLVAKPWIRSDAEAGFGRRDYIQISFGDGYARPEAGKIERKRVQRKNKEHDGTGTLSHSASEATAGSPSPGIGTIPGSDGTGEIDRYLAELRARIQSLVVYPPVARALKLSGRVEIEFSVNQSGSVSNVGIVQPAPFKILNESALSFIQSLKRVAPIPEGAQVNSVRIVVPVEYSLRP